MEFAFPPCKARKNFEKLFKNPLTKPQKCGIIIMSRGRGYVAYLIWLKQGRKLFPPRSKKKPAEFFEKPLDKSTKVWYNNSTVRETKSQLNKFL